MLLKFHSWSKNHADNNYFYMKILLRQRLNNRPLLFFGASQTTRTRQHSKSKTTTITNTKKYDNHTRPSLFLFVALLLLSSAFCIPGEKRSRRRKGKRGGDHCGHNGWQWGVQGQGGLEGVGRDKVDQKEEGARRVSRAIQKQKPAPALKYSALVFLLCFYLLPYVLIIHRR